jgi:hypothetical protein
MQMADRSSICAGSAGSDFLQIAYCGGIGKRLGRRTAGPLVIAHAAASPEVRL